MALASSLSPHAALRRGALLPAPAAARRQRHHQQRQLQQLQQPRPLICSPSSCRSSCRSSSSGGSSSSSGSSSGGSGTSSASASTSSSSSSAPTTSSSSTSTSSGTALGERLAWQLLLLAAAAPPPPALADDALSYDASRGEGIVKTLSGAAYIGLLLYFLTRVLNRRARKAREERLAGQGPITTIFTKMIEQATEGKPRPQATPGAALLGAVQAGLIGFGLFVFTTKVEGIISGQDLPSGYTARNIAITVRTILIGLLYLGTFIFSANAVGLTGLSVQLLLFPDSLPDDEGPAAARVPRGPQLPKVTVTSSPDEIRKAFKAVSKAPAEQAAGQPGAGSGGASGSSGSSGSPAGTQAGAAASGAASSSMDGGS